MRGRAAIKFSHAEQTPSCVACLIAIFGNTVWTSIGPALPQIESGAPSLAVPRLNDHLSLNEPGCGNKPKEIFGNAFGVILRRRFSNARPMATIDLPICRTSFRARRPLSGSLMLSGMAGFRHIYPKFHSAA